MKMDLNAKYGFEKMLYNEARKIGIELNSEMISNFKKYKDLIICWNEKMNLTAITKENDIVMKHFIDCLEIVKYIKNGESIIDVGTGAGFPGIVIAIYFEGKVNITLLDALNKRLIFLQEVIDELKLKNIEIVHARAEEYAHDKMYREKFDVVVSRAVAPLNILLEYDIAYLKVGGRCLLLKGDNVDIEILNSKNALNVLNSKITNKYSYNYCLDNEIYSRFIVEVEKVGMTPDKYPRDNGRIKKSPL